MRRSSPFLSSKINLPRIGLAIVVIVLCAFGLMLGLSGDTEAKRWAGGLLTVSILALLLRARLRSRLLPALAPEQPAFRVHFPSVFRTLPWLFAGAALPWFFILTTVPKLSEIWDQAGWISVPWILVPALCLSVLVCLSLFLLAKALIVPLAVSSDGETIRIHYLLYRESVKLEALGVTRLEDRSGDNLLALRLDSGAWSGWLPASLALPPEARWCAQLLPWLERRGVAIRRARLLGQCSMPRFIFLGLLEITAQVTVMLLTATAVMAAVFWLQWLTTGVINIELQIIAPAYGLLLGILLYLIPLRGWIWKLIRVLPPEPSPPPGAHRVSVLEPDVPPLTPTPRTRAWVKEEAGVLTLALGRRQWLIRPEQVERLACPSWHSHFWDINFGERALGRPIELAWRDEDGVSHLASLISRAGWSFGHDRRLDRALFKALERWRAGAHAEAHAGNDSDAPEAATIASLPTGRRWPAPLWASLFLLCGFALPFLHNYLLMSRVRTGRWLPPASLQPQHPIRPVWPHVETVYPASQLYIESNTAGENAGLLMRFWLNNPMVDKPRILGGIDYALIIPAHPGPQRYLLRYSWTFLPVCHIPARTQPRNPDFPPQLIDTATGQATDLPNLPSAIDRSVLAMSGGGRIFFASQTTFPNIHERGIGWLDGIGGAAHSLGNIPATEDCPSVFFPDGRHVLYSWQVIDLMTGKRQPVQKPAMHGMTPINIFGNSVFASTADTFAAGNRLRLRMRYEDKTTTTGPGTNGRITEIWEIDPASAQCKVIRHFPPSVSLCSADGDRWLLTENVAGHPDEIMLKLFDQRTGLSRVIRRERCQESYALIAGTPFMISFSEKEGWRRLDIGK